MNHEILFLYGRAIAGITVGCVSWLGNSIAQVQAPDQPWAEWVDRYGLPLVMLALALYVITVLYKALRLSEAARITEKQNSLETYIADFKAAQEQRNEVILKLEEQTMEFRGLKETFRACPGFDKQ